jgi:hypothetical protein
MQQISRDEGIEAWIAHASKNVRASRVHVRSVVASRLGPRAAKTAAVAGDNGARHSSPRAG